MLEYVLTRVGAGESERERARARTRTRTRAGAGAGERARAASAVDLSSVVVQFACLVEAALSRTQLAQTPTDIGHRCWLAGFDINLKQPLSHRVVFSIVLNGIE